MKVIVTYDVAAERIPRVRSVLRKYLLWVQNSVFEGELDRWRLNDMIVELTRVMDENYDSIRVYIKIKGKMRSLTIGKEKGTGMVL